VRNVGFSNPKKRAIGGQYLGHMVLGRIDVVRFFPCHYTAVHGSPVAFAQYWPKSMWFEAVRKGAEGKLRPPLGMTQVKMNLQ
jgi:hypothetical protein